MVGRIRRGSGGSSVEMKMKMKMKIEITIKEPNRRFLFKAGGCLRGMASALCSQHNGVAGG